MPKYKVIVNGDTVEWDLPFERLVYDQRFDHDSARWVVRQVRDDAIVVEPNPGTRQGGDPKKDVVP